MDPRAFRPVNTGAGLLYTIKELSGDKFSFKRKDNNESSIDLITGNDDVRKGTYSLTELWTLWEKDASQFKEMSKKYYLYQ